MAKTTHGENNVSLARGINDANFRTLVESLGEAVGVAQNGKLKYVNPKAVEISGFSGEELTSRPFTEFIHPEDQDWVAKLHAQRSSGDVGAATYQHRIIDKQGTVKWVQKTVVSIDWNGEPAALHIDRDITEQRRIEQALTKSEAELRLLVDSSDAAIISIDAERRITQCNPAFLTMFGYSRAEVIGESFAMFYPDEQSFTLIGKEAYSAVEETGVWQGEWTYQTKDQTPVPCETILSAQRDADNRITGYTSIMRDISERKRAEQEKAALEAQLRQAQKMEAIGTLAGGIAHDFNNILGAVMGFTELALDRAQEGKVSPEELVQVLTAAGRARDLVKQILTFSRKVEPQLKPMDLNGVAANSIRLLERTIPKMITIEGHFDSGVFHVQGDPIQLEQVLMNLGSNASDAMAGGGRLVVETENVVLDETYCKGRMEVEPGDYVLMKVSDNGCGMDQETLRQIFDPFFTTKPVGKGTGLGMSTVFGIVKAHGGHLTCYSEPGMGTAFNIFLPALKPGTEIRAEKPDGPKESASGKETILLVDDEKSLREVGLRFLSRQGYRVLTAASGEEALDLYSEMGGEIDLVLLDVGMPGMGGAKCLEKLVKINPDIQVIIASGYSREAQLEDLMASGAAGFVSKPFRQAEALRIIRGVLALAAVSHD